MYCGFPGPAGPCGAPAGGCDHPRQVRQYHPIDSDDHAVNVWTYDRKGGYRRIRLAGRATTGAFHPPGGNRPNVAARSCWTYRPSARR